MQSIDQAQLEDEAAGRTETGRSGSDGIVTLRERQMRQATEAKTGTMSVEHK